MSNYASDDSEGYYDEDEVMNSERGMSTDRLNTVHSMTHSYRVQISLRTLLPSPTTTMVAMVAWR